MHPRAQAVAVRGNRIAFVGTTDEVRAWRGPRTEVVAAGGRTLLPGFVDSHFHLLWGSLKLAKLQLDAAHSLDELGALVHAYAHAHPEKEWIEGVQLLYSAIPRDRPLDRHFLDALVPDRPVFLTAFDAHTAFANTEALRRGGLLHGRPVPQGSQIVMDPATGLATGELREPGAFDPIRQLLPKPDMGQKRTLLQQGLALCARHGITSVHNMDGNDNSIELYAALEEAGELTVRVYVPYDIKPDTPLDALADAVALRARYQGSHVRAGPVKLFMDGVLESYTALLIDDYADAPGNCGSALYTAEHFAAIAAEADRLGLQIFVHACGDGAVRRTLDGYAHARRVNGARDSRHRVEHIEVIHPEDILRLSELGVVASMQPAHCPPLPHVDDVWPHRAGEARWPYSFPWQTLRRTGAPLAFGSDWPVVGMDPMAGIHAGLVREPWAPGHPAQRQTLEDLIAGYTSAGAYAEFQEGEKGRIRVGMLADLVLLSEDIFTTPPEEIRRVRPVLTVCDGRVVFRGL
jgi:hypothetical protein